MKIRHRCREIEPILSRSDSMKIAVDFSPRVRRQIRLRRGAAIETPALDGGKRRYATYVFTVLPRPVAQTCGLLYRRVALCQTSTKHGAWDRSDAVPITNRRYGRLKICATVNGYCATLAYEDLLVRGMNPAATISNSLRENDDIVYPHSANNCQEAM
jgi:hypothetical protein